MTLATDESHKGMKGSAVDTFHDAVAANPKSAAARLGLAKALENVSNPTPVQIREAAFQMRASVALSPELSENEKEHFLSKADKLDTKAGRRENRQLVR